LLVVTPVAEKTQIIRSQKQFCPLSRGQTSKQIPRSISAAPLGASQQSTKALLLKRLISLPELKIF
jgi:hypothetical protein